MKLYFLILCVAILLNVCNNHLIHLVLSIHNINLYNSLPCNGIIRKNQYIAARMEGISPVSRMSNMPDLPSRKSILVTPLDKGGKVKIK